MKCYAGVLCPTQDVSHVCAEYPGYTHYLCHDRGQRDTSRYTILTYISSITVHCYKCSSLLVLMIC
jgi:hypothetical protein